MALKNPTNVIMMLLKEFFRTLNDRCHDCHKVTHTFIFYIQRRNADYWRPLSTPRGFRYSSKLLIPALDIAYMCTYVHSSKAGFLAFITFPQGLLAKKGWQAFFYNCFKNFYVKDYQFETKKPIFEDHIKSRYTLGIWGIWCVYGGAVSNIHVRRKGTTLTAQILFAFPPRTHEDGRVACLQHLSFR